jgi:hypothetical protein
VAGGHQDAFRVDPAFFSGVARFVTQIGLPLAGD